MKNTLTLGYITTKDLRENFFHISKNTFRNNQEYYLDELSAYCHFESNINARGFLGVTILEIYCEGPYTPHTAKTEIEQYVLSQWGKYDNLYNQTRDSLSTICDRYCEEHNIPYDTPWIEGVATYAKENIKVTKRNRKIYKDELVHNPERKQRWYVYGVMQRALDKQRKENPSMQITRCLLQKQHNTLIAKPLAKELEAELRNHFKPYYSQDSISLPEAKYLQETLINEAEMYEGIKSSKAIVEDVLDSYEIFRELKDVQKWNDILALFSQKGIDIIQGTERQSAL